MTKTNVYQLRLEGHGLNLKKQIPPIVAHKIVSIVLGADAMTSGDLNAVVFPNLDQLNNVSGSELSPKAFMDKKSPKTDIEKITCLAYYLTYYRKTREFKTRELTDLNREAAQPKFSNPAVSVRNAASYTYLASADAEKKQITSLGENLVSALPDRDKVKIVIESRKGRKRRRRKSKRGDISK